MKDEHKEECIRELTQVAQSVLESGKLSELAETLEEWRATALALWDQERNKDRKGYEADEPILEEEFQ